MAPCEKAIIGHGSADWRSTSHVAGPVGVMRPALKRMQPTANGLVAKMPILVEGREPDKVTVSVPPALRGRVSLYYGNVIGRDGKPTTAFNAGPGHTETVFELCGNKPRTIWPGGIRVRGRKPVRLDVWVEGRDKPFRLQLGRPEPYDPS